MMILTVLFQIIPYKQGGLEIAPPKGIPTLFFPLPQYWKAPHEMGSGGSFAFTELS